MAQSVTAEWLIVVLGYRAAVRKHESSVPVMNLAKMMG